jgi:hypothetical protein
MKNTAIGIIVTCLTFFFMSCQHDELKDSDLVVTEGYIDIHIIGRSADNLQLDESERFSVFPVGKEAIYSGVSGSENNLHFSIGRQNDLNGSSYLITGFDYQSGIVSNITVDLSFQKKLEGNASLLFSARTGININSSDIVVDGYDSSTGYLSGNFTYLVSNQYANDSAREAIVSGEFYVNVRKIIY